MPLVGVVVGELNSGWNEKMWGYVVHCWEMMEDQYSEASWIFESQSQRNGQQMTRDVALDSSPVSRRLTKGRPLQEKKSSQYPLEGERSEQEINAGTSLLTLHLRQSYPLS